MILHKFVASHSLHNISQQRNIAHHRTHKPAQTHILYTGKKQNSLTYDPLHCKVTILAGIKVYLKRLQTEMKCLHLTNKQN